MNLLIFDEVDGFPFIHQITIQGDWSAVGTAPGQHALEAINPLWTIDRNFEFDGTSTVFRAHIDEYINDDAYGLALTYSLHGALVPEPRTYVLMVAGLALVGFAAHRRNRR